jgi:uncharacterized membrane protein YbhN (UPF0104 family)
VLSQNKKFKISFWIFLVTLPVPFLVYFYPNPNWITPVMAMFLSVAFIFLEFIFLLFVYLKYKPQNILFGIFMLFALLNIASMIWYVMGISD